MEISDDKWYKHDPDDTIWWLDNTSEVVGEWVFSFDKVETFNMFADYPEKLTPEQKESKRSISPIWRLGA